MNKNLFRIINVLVALAMAFGSYTAVSASKDIAGQPGVVAAASSQHTAAIRPARRDFNPASSLKNVNNLAAGVPAIHNVFVIVMESYGWATIHNNASAPYINSLLPQASYATQYFPPDNIDLSLPQYIWFEAGDNLGITNDSSPAVNSQTTTDHLVTYLNNAGVSWKGYFEDVSGNNCPTSDVNSYAVRHDPMVYFTDVSGNSAYCISHIRPYAELASDLNNNSVAQYDFIIPNTCNDMHDNCGSGAISQGDTWLKNNLPQILNSQTYQNGGAVFITWDNDDSSMSNPIPMIVLSPLARGGGYNNAIHYTHGSLLKTVEEIFGITPLLGSAGSTTDLFDLFNTSVGASPTPPSMTPTVAAPTSTPAPTNVPPTFTPTSTGMAPTSTPAPTNVPPTFTPTFTQVPTQASTNVPTSTPAATATLSGFSGKAYYVNPSGNDSNSGSAASPFKTLAKGASVVTPGDTLIASGTFHEQFNVANSGTSSAPIIYIGQNAVIDTTTNMGIAITASYVDVKGFEVEHTAGHALWNVGQHNIIENNIVHDNVTQNGTNGNCGSMGGGGWASGISIKLGSDDVIVRNNQSYNNCGEGLAVTRGTNVLLDGNTVYNNYSVNIYIDNSHDVTVQNNSVACSDFNLRNGIRATGIADAAEPYSGWGFQRYNNYFYLNIVYDCYDGIALWAPDVSGLTTNIQIKGDVVPTGIRRSISITSANDQNVVVQDNQGFALPFVDDPSGVTLLNNVIFGVNPTSSLISGNTGVAGAALAYTDGTSKAVMADQSGNYLLTVPLNWSGTVTPVLPCYTFNPSSYTYGNLTGNQPSQNFTATYISGCTNVNVSIGGASQGVYTLLQGTSARQSYAGVNNGPVKISSSTGMPIIASQRVAYFNGNAWTSFAESLGLPASQLTTSYVMPWYNNADLNSQLRFGNVGSASTTVTVKVGGVVTGTYPLAPSQSARVSYAGLNNGPVQISSSGGVPIITSERVAYTPDGGTTWPAFSELMGLPAGQLTTSYVMPVYDNVNLNTQLRFGNLGSANTTVTVKVGGVVKGTYPLAPSQSMRVSYTGLNGGPVQISSSGGVKIIASERVAYFDGTVWTSFAEMMGLPGGRATTSYLVPWYNDADLDTQLRFGNVGSASTTVTVTIGGVVQGTYALAPNQTSQVSYAGVNSGPVQISSSGGVKIVAAERVAYNNGSAWSSFAEMMGLPSSQLTTSYVMPWYNDADLNTQLRFAVP